MRREHHRLSLVVLACALFLRMLVPAGWMPAASGALAIEPCPAAEAPPVVAMAGHHHDPGHHSHGAHHDGDCAFAPLTSAFAGSQMPPMLVPPATAGPLIDDAGTRLFFARGPPAPPPPATGPPAIA